MANLWHEVEDLLLHVDLGIFGDETPDSPNELEMHQTESCEGELENGVARSPKNASKTGPKRKRVRASEELLYLRSKTNELHQKLDALKVNKDSMICTKWESLARQEAIDSYKAIQENTRLKQALEQQLKVTEALEKIISKKPKFIEASVLESCTENWHSRRLVAEPHGRQKAFHTIADEAYGRTDSILVRNKLVDEGCNMHNCNIRYNDFYRSIMLDTAFRLVANVSMDLCAQALWKIFRTEVCSELPVHAFEVSECVVDYFLKVYVMLNLTDIGSTRRQYMFG